jgi:hypothetical protein
MPRSPKTSLVAHATTTGSPMDGLIRVKDSVLETGVTRVLRVARERDRSLARRRVWTGRMGSRYRGGAKDLRAFYAVRGWPAHAINYLYADHHVLNFFEGP